MLEYLISLFIVSFLRGLFFCTVTSGIAYLIIKQILPKKSNLDPNIKKFFLNQYKKNKEKMYTSSPDDLIGSNSTVNSINLIFKFLFQELADTIKIRDYIQSKLNEEFDELLTTKAAGKLIQKISTRDFSLSKSLAEIHDIKLISHEMDQDLVQEMSVLIDFEYTNGFSIAVDADLILGRQAYVKLKISSIKGRIRLQFIRHPFVHWSVVFLEDPEIEIDAASQFDGREIPQITQLLINQIEKSIRKKHTLPNYKCRQKPFFEQTFDRYMFKEDLDRMEGSENNKTKLENSNSSSVVDELIKMQKSQSLITIITDDPNKEGETPLPVNQLKPAETLDNYFELNNIDRKRKSEPNYDLAVVRNDSSSTLPIMGRAMGRKTAITTNNDLNKYITNSRSSSLKESKTERLKSHIKQKYRSHKLDDAIDDKFKAQKLNYIREESPTTRLRTRSGGQSLGCHQRTSSNPNMSLPNILI